MGVGQVERRWRERELASDSRAGEGVRGRVRADMLSTLRRGWRRFLVAAVAGVVVVGGSSYFVPDERMQGVLLGAGLTWWFGMLWFTVVQVSGVAPRLMGADGETWTASEARKLRRGGWRIVNDVFLTRTNIDHVLVGPAGVIAVESKWSSRHWASPAGDIAVLVAARQASEQARRLRLWQPIKAVQDARVVPLVVLWGAGTAGDGARQHHTVVDGVDVVVGHHLRAWVSARHGSVLDTAAIEQIWSDLADHCARREGHERRVTPRPRRPRAVLAEAGALLVAFFAGVVAASLLAADLRDPARWIAAGCVVLLAGLVAWRIRRARRWLAWAAAGAVALTVLLTLLVGSMYL